MQMNKESNETRQTGAQFVVRILEAQGVTHVFGIPGAKIDSVFNALLDSKIQTVVCRHEQNAAFIAGGIGRMTGKAGVAIATSGPGVSNLVTGLATANSEGDPVVALGGAITTAEAANRPWVSLCLGVSRPRLCALQKRSFQSPGMAAFSFPRWS
jgi:acetolactate synthase I/II/III large subunit